MELNREYHDSMDEIEDALQECPEPYVAIRHFFAPGVYCREMLVQAGSVITSKIHKTEHQFTLSVGSLRVMTEDGGEIFIEAPYIGLTKPGTRRVAFFPVDSVWTTVHKLPWLVGNEGDDPETMEATVQQIEDELIEPYENKLLEGEFKNILI